MRVGTRGKCPGHEIPGLHRFLVFSGGLALPAELFRQAAALRLRQPGQDRPKALCCLRYSPRWNRWLASTWSMPMVWKFSSIAGCSRRHLAGTSAGDFQRLLEEADGLVGILAEDGDSPRPKEAWLKLPIVSRSFTLSEFSLRISL